jgi:NhaP-type Na+/H+ and K+/H+ antiporter
MIPAWWSTVYSATLHLLSIIVISVLMAISTISTDVGLPILLGLIGLGVGVGVNPAVAIRPVASVAVPPTPTTGA